MPEVKTLQDWDRIALDFLKAFPNGGVFGLSGELGVGKSSFVRAVIGQLCKRRQLPLPRVISPTYVLHQRYDLQPAVDHFDLYRLPPLNSAGLTELGFWETLETSQKLGGYLFVEWPDRLPPEIQRTSVRFEFHPHRSITWA
ncbi:tRNA (adenosine(37)-N6)-threonylcarbamoyltransferase complex ATPase subunit type 1 TsaE [bacterium]|nr:tRNA (adenosine(37)-N6)-threonylcarbamoyltransferase complex ATPase subunit type 1 TsaE [bacterium]